MSPPVSKVFMPQHHSSKQKRSNGVVAYCFLTIHLCKADIRSSTTCTTYTEWGKKSKANVSLSERRSQTCLYFAERKKRR